MDFISCALAGDKVEADPLRRGSASMFLFYY